VAARKKKSGQKIKAAATRTMEDTTVAELMETVAPPRPNATGVHVIGVGKDFLIAVQGPESLHMTRRILDFVEAMHQAVEMKGSG